METKEEVLELIKPYPKLNAFKMLMESRDKTITFQSNSKEIDKTSPTTETNEKSKVGSTVSGNLTRKKKHRKRKRNDEAELKENCQMTKIDVLSSDEETLVNRQKKKCVLIDSEDENGEINNKGINEKNYEHVQKSFISESVNSNNVQNRNRKLNDSNGETKAEEEEKVVKIINTKRNESLNGTKQHKTKTKPGWKIKLNVIETEIENECLIKQLNNANEKKKNTVKHHNSDFEREKLKDRTQKKDTDNLNVNNVQLKNDNDKKIICIDDSDSFAENDCRTIIDSSLLETSFEKGGRLLRARKVKKSYCELDLKELKKNEKDLDIRHTKRTPEKNDDYKKIAPIFLNKKKKVDKKILEARREFLMSPLPDFLKKEIVKQQRYFIIFYCFLHILHIYFHPHLFLFYLQIISLLHINYKIIKCLTNEYNPAN